MNWLCGNPPSEEYIWSGYDAYANEAGFLTNFTTTELSAVKTVTQKSILSYPEYDGGLADSGSKKHEWYSKIDDVVANYTEAYSENVTDRMFMLDVKQVNTVYNNGAVLGGDYYMAYPTEKAVLNSKFTNESFSAEQKWNYWLRSPLCNISLSVRYVYGDGCVDTRAAGGGDGGARPAFFLAENTLFASGDGSELNPYVVYNEMLSTDNEPSSNNEDKILEVIKAEDETVTIECKNIGGLESSQIILAGYNVDGILRQIMLRDVSEIVEFTGVDFTAGKIKVMLWQKSDAITPISDFAEIILE